MTLVFPPAFPSRVNCVSLPPVLLRSCFTVTDRSQVSKFTYQYKAYGGGGVVQSARTIFLFRNMTTLASCSPAW